MLGHFKRPRVSLFGLLIAVSTFALVVGVYRFVADASSESWALYSGLQLAINLAAVIVAVLSYVAYARRERLHHPQTTQNNTLNMNRNLLGAAAGGMICLDDQFDIVYINDLASEVLGLSSWSEGAPLSSVLNFAEEEGYTHVLDDLTMANIALNNDAMWHEHDILVADEVKTMQYKVVSTTDMDTEFSYMLIVEDLSEAKKVMAELSHQASRDSLTGLFNRTSLEQTLSVLLDQQTLERRGSHNCSVLCYLDLDHFKIVNDTCGHAAGDELLAMIAKMFKSLVRVSDTVARVGGDEFVLLLPNCGVQKAQSILEKVIKDVSDFKFIWKQQSFSVGVSIGAVEINEQYTSNDMAYLISEADDACYKAKKSGRNQYHFVNPSKQQIALDSEESWQKFIKQSIERDNLALYVQPIVPLSESPMLPGKANHYEVLVRLPHADSVLEPGSFLPTAQRLGLMGQVDRWVVKKTIIAVANANTEEHGLQQTLFNINMSADLLMDEDFIPYLKDTLEHYQVSAQQLCFEVSESVALANFAQATEMFVQLKQLGCYASLDNFGSGFSSLSYLREMAIDYLKIDGLFIRNMVNNCIDEAMVDAVNMVGKVMNLKTIAEYVEDERTADMLRDIGVDYAQGYHCGKPMPISEIIDEAELEDA